MNDHFQPHHLNHASMNEENYMRAQNAKAIEGLRAQIAEEHLKHELGTELAHSLLGKYGDTLALAVLAQRNEKLTNEAGETVVPTLDFKKLPLQAADVVIATRQQQLYASQAAGVAAEAARGVTSSASYTELADATKGTGVGGIAG